MKDLKRVFVIGFAMMALTALSGCHASAVDYKTRWVSETDSKKVLELTLRNPNVLGRVHMVVFGQNVRGTYVLKDGDKTVAGSVTQLDGAYKLVSSDGKEQKFSRDGKAGSLKDESGGTWKPDNPPATATLKEW